MKAAQRLYAHKLLKDEWGPGTRSFHSAVGCLLMAADTLNFSFQLRAPSTDEPECYGTWGGGIDGNESTFEALKRELKEETGYSGPIRIYPLMTYYDQDSGFQYYNNLVTVPEEFTIKAGPKFKKESSGDIWVPFGAWPEPLHPGLKSLLQDDPSMLTVRSVMKIVERAKSRNKDPMHIAASNFKANL